MNKRGIFLSTSCLAYSKIEDVVEALAKRGVRHIELSGGTKYHGGCMDSLLTLRKRYRLHYLVHNYFPPPREDFVMNLASMSSDVVKKTVKHAKKAIELCAILGSPYYSMHAGFFVEVTPSELGDSIKNAPVIGVEKKTAAFIENFIKLKSYARERGVSLFLENNVYSAKDFSTFGERVPSMLVTYNDYLILKKSVDFNLLLDIAHLKISCRSLGIRFEKETSDLLDNAQVRYMHISENDGRRDAHMPLKANSEIWKVLKTIPDSVNTITLEMKSEATEKVYDSYFNIQNIMEGAQN
ncbi:MAG: TIM barrel protein [Candidatus Omnitrophica bacterium]|nr:TIM barrel protein [Candidatus Omnitrophota bacterium]